MDMNLITSDIIVVSFVYFSFTKTCTTFFVNYSAIFNLVNGKLVRCIFRLLSLK